MRRAILCALLGVVGAFAMLASAAIAVADDAAPTAVDRAARPRPELVIDVSDGPLTVSLRAAPKSPKMGEPIRLRLTARIAGNAAESRGQDPVGATPAPQANTPNTTTPNTTTPNVVWPNLAEALVKALGEDIVEVGAVRRAPDGRSLETELRLYDAGEFALPDLTIRLPDNAGGTRANVVLSGGVLSVASVLDETDEALEPVPGRDAVAYDPDLGWSWLPFAIGAAVLIAAAAAILLLRRRNTLPDAPPPAPVVPPHERALSALRALAAERLPERGAVDPYFTQLSEILRGYLEERFSLRAPEQTTEEFLAGLSRTAAGQRAITAAHREILADFLSQADLVKFARAEPDIGTCESAGNAAERFVQETAPRGAAHAPVAASDLPSTGAPA